MPKRTDHPTATDQGDWGSYCRKSTDDPKKQRMSLPDQKKSNDQQFESLPENQKTGRKFIEYPHESISAFDPINKPRSVFKTIIRDIEAKKIYGLIATDFTRVSRNPKDTGEFMHFMKAGFLKCFVASTTGRTYWWNNADDIMNLTMDGGLACKDSMNKSSVVKARMEERAKEGKQMGRKDFGFKPHVVIHEDGYEERITVVDELRLPHAIKMFELAAAGYSLKQIVEWANDPKKPVRARPAKNNPTGKLGRSGIAHILHSPYFKGFTRMKKKEDIPWGKHTPRRLMPNGELLRLDKPPVSESLWLRAQLMLTSRQTNTAKPHDEILRKLFTFGSAICCGKCGGLLSPYRVVKAKSGTMYIYYECKDTEKHCRVSIRQELLEEQFDFLLTKIDPGDTELDRARGNLVTLHHQKSSFRKDQRKELQEQYEKLEQTINAQIAALPSLKVIGLEENAIQQLKNLKTQRDEIKAELDRVHDEGSAWIGKMISCFELVKMAQEMLQYGSPRVRDKMLKAIASNYPLIDGKVVPDLRSPYKEAAQREGLPEWWAILGSNQ